MQPFKPPFQACLQLGMPQLPGRGFSSSHGCTWLGKCSQSYPGCQRESSGMCLLGASWLVPFDQIKTILTLFGPPNHLSKS